MSFGVYFCLIFCVVGPWAACCSYKRLYLKNFEKKRKKTLGVKDPYKDQ